MAITGTGLNGASAVAPRVPASSFSVVSPNQIEAVSPPGGAAPVDVTVTTPAGTSSTGIE